MWRQLQCERFHCRPYIEVLIPIPGALAQVPFGQVQRLFKIPAGFFHQSLWLQGREALAPAGPYAVAVGTSMPAGSYYKATPGVRSGLSPTGTCQYRKAARARQYLAHTDASCCWSGPTPHALSAWTEGPTTQAGLSSVRLGLRRFPVCTYRCPASASQAADSRGYILGCRSQRPSRSAVSRAEFMLVSGRQLWLPLRSP